MAVEAERRAYLDAHADVVDADGHRVVVGNGYLPVREVTTGAGVVEVCAPRVHDSRPDHGFTPTILPRYMRRSPKVTEVLPVLYLRGLSTGDFAPALEEFFGSDAGLSASTIQRLTEAWQTEHAHWVGRDLSDVDSVYWWADGIWFNVRLPDSEGNQDRLCCLVIIGVRPDGRKELVAVADGYRESTDSWAEVLRGLRDRGLRAPELAVGDGALGFWGALRDVFDGKVAKQRCWVHKTANILDALPKRLHPDAKGAIHRIYLSECRTDTLDAVGDFADIFDEFPQGRGEDHRRSGHPVGVLRLPQRAPEAPALHQRHRVDVRHREAEDQGHQGRRQLPSRPRHGLQARRRRPRPMATNRRTPSRRPCPNGSHLHRRRATRKEQHRPAQPRRRRRLTMTPSTRFANISQWVQLGD